MSQPMAPPSTSLKLRPEGSTWLPQSVSHTPNASVDVYHDGELAIQLGEDERSNLVELVDVWWRFSHRSEALRRHRTDNRGRTSIAGNIAYATEWTSSVGGSIINLGGCPGSPLRVAYGINDAGQGVGVSYTNIVPPPPLPVPEA